MARNAVGTDLRGVAADVVEQAGLDLVDGRRVKSLVKPLAIERRGLVV
jgi:hypothetical protein